MLRTLQQQATWSSARPPLFLSCSNGGNRMDRPSFLSLTEALPKVFFSKANSGPIKFLPVRASLTEVPVLWAVRTCVFYALLQTGIAGPPPASSVYQGDVDGLQAPSWLKDMFGKDEEVERAKLLTKGRSKWQTTTKGTLKRRFRVPSKSEGRRLLIKISSLLSDDDTFRDATSHKGCQIRRENAHAETVCCHNVRAMFDELPTPHLVIEITAFPAGPITTSDYEKADKIEMLLRTGTSI